MKLPKRKPYRLQGYDYSQRGAYFLTLCVKDRSPMLWRVGATFGRPPEGAEHLSEYGRIIDFEIGRIEDRYAPVVKVDSYVIMPNHIHMIMMILGTENGRPKVAPTISRIMQQWKGSVSKRVGRPIWQKSFYDHMIRSEAEYSKIRKYIDENPLKWEDDCYYI